MSIVYLSHGHLWKNIICNIKEGLILVLGDRLPLLWNVLALRCLRTTSLCGFSCHSICQLIPTTTMLLQQIFEQVKLELSPRDSFWLVSGKFAVLHHLLPNHLDVKSLHAWVLEQDFVNVLAFTLQQCFPDLFSLGDFIFEWPATSPYDLEDGLLWCLCFGFLTSTFLWCRLRHLNVMCNYIPNSPIRSKRL